MKEFLWGAWLASIIAMLYITARICINRRRYK